MRRDGSRAVIDFNGIAAISSSYADELIGKMVASIGFVRFTQVCSLKNLSPFVASVINRSVQQRMAQIYYSEEMLDE
ncbi:MAG: STAS-like domain-containing protein [Christensenellaceae bacterium]|nr:STAS-like domain-containing protein [Christensenellaceae bacterium]